MLVTGINQVFKNSLVMGPLLRSGDRKGQMMGNSYSHGMLVLVRMTESFVPDYGNNRIQIFSKDGDFIASWGAAGSSPGQFDGPAVVAFDAQRNVYVTDSGNHRVQKFTGNGTFLTEWGREGQADGQFSMPEGLAVDPSTGKVYVSDTSNNNVQVFAASEN